MFECNVYTILSIQQSTGIVHRMSERESSLSISEEEYETSLTQFDKAFDGY